MTDVDLSLPGILALRLLNAVLWTLIALRLRKQRTNRPVLHQLVGIVLVVVTWTLVLGAIATYISTDFVRMIYTTLSTFMAIIATAILLEHWRA